jgi:hypothetical protein
MGERDILAQAMHYHEQGIAVIPFAPKSKGQAYDGFGWKPYQHTEQATKEVEILFTGRGDANIAGIGGEPSHNLAFVELDSSQAFEAAGRLLAGYGLLGDEGSSAWLQQRDHFDADDPHAGGGHAWLRTPQPVRTKHTKDGWEIRGQGAIAIAPPSIHPTGAASRRS